MIMWSRIHLVAKRFLNGFEKMKTTYHARKYLQSIQHANRSDNINIMKHIVYSVVGQCVVVHICVY